MGNQSLVPCDVLKQPSSYRQLYWICRRNGSSATNSLDPALAQRIFSTGVISNYHKTPHGKLLTKMLKERLLQPLKMAK